MPSPRIRPIAADELPAFIALSSPAHAAEQSAYVTDLFERGAMRAGWRRFATRREFEIRL